MAKGQRTDCYKPNKGKRKGCLKNGTGTVEHVPRPAVAVSDIDLGKAVPNPEQRARDERDPSLGPMLGKPSAQTHTRRLIELMSR